MKVTRRQLMDIINSTILREGKLSKSEKEDIKLQVELELGEEFELIASQVKDIDEFDRVEAIFQKKVSEETDRRIKDAESMISDDRPFKQSFKDEKRSWDSFWTQPEKKEIIPFDYESGMATIDVTPDEDDDNSYKNNPDSRPLTSLDMSRRDFIKSAGMGVAAAGQIGRMAGLFDFDSGNSISEFDSMCREMLGKYYELFEIDSVRKEAVWKENDFEIKLEVADDYHESDNDESWMITSSIRENPTDEYMTAFDYAELFSEYDSAEQFIDDLLSRIYEATATKK